MPASIETLHPQHAAMFLRRLEDGDHRQLYRVIYFSVTTDEQDLNQRWVHKCTVHYFAQNGEEMYRVFMANVPEHYPLAELVSIAPVQPDVPEDSLLVVESTPTPITGPSKPTLVEH